MLGASWPCLTFGDSESKRLIGILLNNAGCNGLPYSWWEQPSTIQCTNFIDMWFEFEMSPVGPGVGTCGAQKAELFRGHCVTFRRQNLAMKVTH